MSKPTDKDPANQRFWRAMQKDDPVETRRNATSGVIDLTEDLSELSGEEREQRLKALRSMLASTQARQLQILRNRLPALTPGLEVGISRGPFRGTRGTVVDADYIHSRALLSIANKAEAQWIEFSSIVPMIDDEPSDSETDS